MSAVRRGQAPYQHEWRRLHTQIGQNGARMAGTAATVSVVGSRYRRGFVLRGTNIDAGDKTARKTDRLMIRPVVIGRVNETMSVIVDTACLSDWPVMMGAKRAVQHKRQRCDHRQAGRETPYQSDGEMSHGHPDSKLNKFQCNGRRYRSP
jgi:hypothetical protein